MHKTVQKRGGGNPEIFTMPEELSRGWIERNNKIRIKFRSDVVFDFSATKKIDSAGLGFIRSTHTLCEKSGLKLILRNISSDLLSSLKSWAASDMNPPR